MLPLPSLLGLAAFLIAHANTICVNALAYDYCDSLDYQTDLELLHSARPSIPLWQALHSERSSRIESTGSLFGSSGAQRQVILSHDDKKKKEKDDPDDGSDKEPAPDPRYPARCFYQPLDHFDPHNNVTFCQRYWVSLEHYSQKRVAPVVVLDGGETSGANRLPFLRKGIVNILSNATSGVGVVLEHRYYGKSLPNVSYPSYQPMTLSTDDLRFLNNEQAEMDSVRFIQNLDLGYLEDSLAEVTGPEHRPWIYYGGSYAGARAAHMIKGWGYEGEQLDKIPKPHPAVEGMNIRGINAINPSKGRVDVGHSKVGVHINISSAADSAEKETPKGLVWGSIASSAVVHAQVSYPEYFEAIRQWAPRECMNTLEHTIETIDTLLEIGGGMLQKQVMGLFGLSELEHVEDFGDVLSSALGSWQARNWDPEVGSDEFYRFCDILTAGGASSNIGFVKIPSEIMNYASYIKENIVNRCPADKNGKRDIEDCFGTYNTAKYRQHDLGQKWRLWIFQVCNQWGYFMPAPLQGPRIISKFITLDYSRKVCAQAFPDGKYHIVPEYPDVDSVNSRGDFALTADRLAYIDGDSDPWRPATAQSDIAPPRNDTSMRPVKWINDAVHHYDENGLVDPSSEPKRIRQVHQQQIEFTWAWVDEWKKWKKAGKI